MVISRTIVLLAVLLLGSGILIVERAIGLPVMFFLFLPWALSMCRQPEKLVTFSLLVLVTAIVYALPVGVAGTFLLATLVLQPMIERYVPATVGAVVKMVSLSGLLIVFALVAVVSISISIVLYSIVVISTFSWLGYKRQNHAHANAAVRERIIVFS